MEARGDRENVLLVKIDRLGLAKEPEWMTGRRRPMGENGAEDDFSSRQLGSLPLRFSVLPWSGRTVRPCNLSRPKAKPSF